MAMISLDRIAASIFVVGDISCTPRTRSPARNAPVNLPSLPSHVTIGSNSNFYNLNSEDRENLGGIEFRSLKLLLKFIIGKALYMPPSYLKLTFSVYFFGLHILGVVCLLPWIHRSPSKYRDYLEEQGLNKTWW